VLHIWSAVQLLVIVQPHSPLLTTHTGVAEPATHAVASVAEHCVHSPASGPEVWQAGVGAAQSASLVQGPHVSVVVLQIGDMPEQSELIKQPTHASLAGLHMGVGSLQSLFDKQATQAPASGPEVAQSGVSGKPAQSVFEVHGPQTLVVRLQMGVVPEQFALLVHPTQVPVASSHAGVGPVHCVVSVDEHSVHSPSSGPLSWQAGFGTEHCALLVHPPHWLVVVSQMGATTGQLVSLRQPQTLVVPVETQFGSSITVVQLVLLRHWTH
jgi:hypothetical protein